MAAKLCTCGEPATKDPSGHPGTDICDLCHRLDFTDPGEA